jgi:hypothetical protein
LGCVVLNERRPDRIFPLVTLDHLPSREPTLGSLPTFPCKGTHGDSLLESSPLWIQLVDPETRVHTLPATEGCSVICASGGAETYAAKLLLLIRPIEFRACEERNSPIVFLGDG